MTTQDLGKPGWDSAPYWARWLAMDSDGTWCWYECEPKEPGECYLFWRVSAGRHLSVAYTDWRKTIEQRPEGE